MDVTSLAAGQQIEAENEQRGHGERGFGQEGAKQFAVIGRHGAPPFNAACITGDCSAGVIQSSRTSGFRPIYTVAAIRSMAPRRSAQVMRRYECTAGVVALEPPPGDLGRPSVVPKNET